MVPIATNCWVLPTAKLFGVAGITTIEDRVSAVEDGRGGVCIDVEIGVVEQEIVIIVKTAINPIVK